MRREKKTAQRTVHLEPRVSEALERLREMEQRTFSSLVSRIVERDPHVQLFLQKIERQVGN